MTRDPIRDALTTENEALRARLAKHERVTIAAGSLTAAELARRLRILAAACETHDSDMLWKARLAVAAAGCEHGVTHEPAPFDRTGEPR